MAVKNLGDGTVTKLAADAKPTASTYPAGTTLQNTDDRKRWVNSATDWIAQDALLYKKFNILKEASTTYVVDKFGKIVQSNTDTQVAVQAQLDSMTDGNVWEFVWDADIFTLNNPIILPSITADLISKKVKMQGTGFVGQRLLTGGATCLVGSGTWPANRYFFELNNAGASSTNTGQVHIDGFQCMGSSSINTGFVKLEAGERLNGLDNFVVSNCFAQYMWRMLTIAGMVWFGRFENLCHVEVSAAFTGDTPLLLTDGGHAGVQNPTPKANLFRNLRFQSTAGTFTNAIRIASGGYNWFRDIFINGNKYSHSVIALNAIDTATPGVGANFIDNCTIFDLVTPTPDVREATVFLGGTGNVWDNTIQNFRCAAYPVTVKLATANVRRNDLEFDANFGGGVTITDSTTDGTNTLRIKGGNMSAAGGDAVIGAQTQLSRIIDTRHGAYRTGTSTQAGNGTQTQFFIGHGLFASPTYVTVTPYSAAASEKHHIGSDPSNITINYPTPPVNGASLIWVWRAELYR